MKMNMLIMWMLCAILGCQNDGELPEAPYDCEIPRNCIEGVWEVKEIFENNKKVQNTYESSIKLQFHEDGKISGHTRNILIGEYEIFEDDNISITVEPITEAGEGPWGEKFLSIIPSITLFSFESPNELRLYSSNRKDQIILTISND